jgi:histidine triad (HIT) family protein
VAKLADARDSKSRGSDTMSVRVRPPAPQKGFCTMSDQQNCIFCAIINKKIPAHYILETDSLIVIKDINPSAPIHYLIIPKEHVIDINALSHNQLVLGREIYACAQKLAQIDKQHTAFKLINNNGYAAGQRVFHMHVHFLSGFTHGQE